MEKKEKEEIVNPTIIKGLKQISKKMLHGKLSTEEDAQFKRAQLAEEQAKEVCYVLGGRLY